MLGCSTAGEIIDTNVHDDAIAISAIAFDHTTLEHAFAPLAETNGSAGKVLAEALPVDGFVHVFVLSSGLQVNGIELVRGLHRELTRVRVVDRRSRRKRRPF